MKESIIEIQREIERILNEMENKKWSTTVLHFSFPPYINKGWTGKQFFFDINDSKVEAVVFGDARFNSILYKCIIDWNKIDYRINEITFSGNKDKLNEGEISVTFNQDIVDQFENNIPKSIRGKTIPWWKNPEETKDLA
jgi:hypothetical protein